MALAETSLHALRTLVGAANVLTMREDLIPYSFDGTAALQQMPGCVIFVTRTEEVAAVLKWANASHTAIATRGSGTGLSGGSLPSQDCVVLCTVRMDKVHEVDRANLTMLV